jgi:hypothetical protein
VRRGLAAALLALAVLPATGALDSASAVGWLRFAVPGARCARGTPYAFWLHPASRAKLLLYFQDGGGCWSYATCAPGSSFFQDALRAPDSPSFPEEGILDLNAASNPFGDFSIVYVPYCTGDVHWGNHVQTYRDGHGRKLVIHHVGFDNASRVLRVIYARYPSPRQVFVTGCSAGSVGSAIFAPYVIRHYPHATVEQLGDSLAFVFPRPVDIRSGWQADRSLPRWIPAIRRLDPARLTMAEYYAAVAGYYPAHTFAQFDYASDAVQTRYFAALGGKPDDFPAALAASLAKIKRSTPNFRAYVAPGSDHCVLPLARFFTTTVAGIPLADWTLGLAAGREVQDVPGP